MTKKTILFPALLTLIPLYDLVAWVYVWNSMPSSGYEEKREMFYHYLPIENFETTFHFIIIGLCILAIVSIVKALHQLYSFTRLAGLFLLIVNVLLLLLKLWGLVN